MSGAPLPILDKGQGTEWRRLQDGAKQARSQLTLVRESLSVMLGQEDDVLQGWSEKWLRLEGYDNKPFSSLYEQTRVLMFHHFLVQSLAMVFGGWS
jgi:hypothetical protein